MARKAILILFLAACSTPTIYEIPPLAIAELRFRPSFDRGPQLQSCKQYHENVCIRMQRDTFDLGDQSVRDRLRDANIFCSVGKKRFHICKDQPGLCTTKEKVTRWIGIPVKRELMIDEVILLPAAIQKLIDVTSRCAAIGSASYEAIFGG